MKVYNLKHQGLRPALMDALNEFRKERGFNANDYIQAKLWVVEQYFKKCQLDTAVVAVSGGIDSAVVLGLAALARDQGRIKSVIGVTLPLNQEGTSIQAASNQKESQSLAQKMCRQWNVECWTMPVNASMKEVALEVEKNAQWSPQGWERGQLVAYQRTPMLYYTNSVLWARGNRSVLMGTTNRDEGAYLGYVGKASDGMVDVQVISDLHKSEVRQVAQKLGVLDEIIKNAPRGDMFDGRNDEEVFGAPYDFVELYLNVKNVNEKDWTHRTRRWNDQDRGQFEQYAQALEKLHQYNHHKYWSGSPAIHLDIQESAVKGGWIEGVHSGLHKKNRQEHDIPMDRFVGFVPHQVPVWDEGLQEDESRSTKMKAWRWVIDDEGMGKNGNLQIHALEEGEKWNPSKDGLWIQNACSTQEIKAWVEWGEKWNALQEKTGMAGQRLSHRLSHGQSHQQHGSERLSWFQPSWTRALEKKIKRWIPQYVHAAEDHPWWEHPGVWKMQGLNPMVRWLKYGPGDRLIAHYDDTTRFNDHEQSLWTCIVALEMPKEGDGGETLFLEDSSLKKKAHERDYADKSPDFKAPGGCVPWKAGDVLIFPHRLLHEGSPVIKGRKIILRTEWVGQRCSF